MLKQHDKGELIFITVIRFLCIRVFPLCSDQEAEWIVQELCNILSLPQRSPADLFAWQAEAYGPIQWPHSREAHLQPHCEHGERTSRQDMLIFTPSTLWLSSTLCIQHASLSLPKCGSYCIQVQSAALDEMFHHGTSSVQRYHRALLLMEGLSRIVTEQKDIDSIDKCMCQHFDTLTTRQHLKMLQSDPLDSGRHCILPLPRLNSTLIWIFQSLCCSQVSSVLSDAFLHCKLNSIH